MSKLFVKGKSGNPGGRPKGVESRVREIIGDDLDKIIETHAKIAQGIVPDGIEIAQLRARDMCESAKFVTDRGWGRPRQTVDVSGGMTISRRVDYSQIADDELDVMLAADEIAARLALVVPDEDPDADPGSPGEDRPAP